MSKHQQTFTLKVDLPTALTLCQEVARELGWRVLELTSSSISVKEVSPQITGFTWPARIDVSLRQLGNAECQLTLNGSISGMGPIQRNHLQGQMGRLLNHLSLLVDKKLHDAVAPAVGNNQSIAEEIRNLKALVDQGILSEAEFAAAKLKLLGS